MADGDNEGGAVVTATDEGSKPVTHSELATFFNEAISEALAPFQALLTGGGGEPDSDGTPSVRMTLRDVEQFAESVVAKAVEKLKGGRPSETDSTGDTSGDTGEGGVSHDVESGTTTTSDATTTTTQRVAESAPIGDAKRLAKQEKRWGSA
jgi:hypothetical protein